MKELRPARHTERQQSYAADPSENETDSLHIRAKNQEGYGVGHDDQADPHEGLNCGSD